jgi:broad specificity phosphatase PhoE
MAPGVCNLPATSRWRAIHAKALERLETLSSEMQDYWDHRSQTWQETERGQTFQERLERVLAALEATSEIDWL